MAVEAGHEDIQTIHPESEYGLKKLDTRTEEPSPRGVLDACVSDASSVSRTSSKCSSEKENCDKGGGFAAAAAAAVAAINPMSYGPPVKDFIDNVKRKSGVQKLSSSTISMLSSYELSAKSIRQKMARMWSAHDDIDCSFIRKRMRNFAYSELVAATLDFSPGKKKRQLISYQSSGLLPMLSTETPLRFSGLESKMVFT